MRTYMPFCVLIYHDLQCKISCIRVVFAMHYTAHVDHAFAGHETETHAKKRSKEEITREEIKFALPTDTVDRTRLYG
jgi:hypothetical protein